MSEEPEPKVRPADFNKTDGLDLWCVPSASSSPKWTLDLHAQLAELRAPVVDSS